MCSAGNSWAAAAATAARCQAHAQMQQERGACSAVPGGACAWAVPDLILTEVGGRKAVSHPNPWSPWLDI